jgi:hypothetical protein
LAFDPDFENQTNDPLFDRSLLTALTVARTVPARQRRAARTSGDSLHRMGKAVRKNHREVARDISQREAIRDLGCSIAKVGQQYALTPV